MPTHGVIATALAAFLLAGPFPGTVDAQQSDIDAAATQDRGARSAMRPAAVTRNVRADTVSLSARVGHYALIGTGVGAVTGFVLAEIAVHKQHVACQSGNLARCDRSEEGFEIGLSAFFGGVGGLALGTIVGLLRGGSP